VWGYGQRNGGPLGDAATYPSMNIRATKGRPVKVQWQNNLPDTHLFCEQPGNANWPCAIDRTLMGTQIGAGWVRGPNGAYYGGAQQPDNAAVVHLHGGDIPPEADGFAELWIGNGATSAAYTPNATTPIDPALKIAGAASTLSLYRPTGNSVLYNYPLNQDAAMIWFHDHALGKTRINVAAGPAGFFQVNDPVAGGEPQGLPSGCDAASYYNLNNLNPPPFKNCFEMNIAFQDRSFNGAQPGTTLAKINYPNGLNWVPAAPVACTVPTPAPAWLDTTVTPAGTLVTPNALTPGPNACLHPQWVPEYFGDVPVVNGMAWPFLDVYPRKYRFHLLDGSNARCWSLAFANNQPITVIATEQGYLNAPVPVTRLTMCPGERYDVIVDFTGLRAGTTLTLTNNAPAPFPKGVAPTPNDVGRVMQFRVIAPPANAPVPLDPSVIPATLAAPGANASLMGGLPPCAFDPAVGGAGLHTKLPAGATACIPMRQKVLNEQLDPVTLFPMRVQIDGKAFENDITETPKAGAIEVWKIVNTTGDAHPMHTHLVRHQIVSRQKFDLAGFSAATNFAIPGERPVCALGTVITPGAKGAPGAPNCFSLDQDVALFQAKTAPVLPGAWEAGWKDASISYPGEVLTIVAKWEGHWSTTVADPSSTTVPPAPAFQAATSGPYVWHCHIVDHEDNEMMRPVVLQP
jgi:FtsP/CotA-like multicopper oxidase with cupredoxin domain